MTGTNDKKRYLCIAVDYRYGWKYGKKVMAAEEINETNLKFAEWDGRDGIPFRVRWEVIKEMGEDNVPKN